MNFLHSQYEILNNRSPEYLRQEFAVMPDSRPFKNNRILFALNLNAVFCAIAARLLALRAMSEKAVRGIASSCTLTALLFLAGNVATSSASTWNGRLCSSLSESFARSWIGSLSTRK